MADSLQNSYYTFNITIGQNVGLYDLNDYLVDVTMTNATTGQESTQTLDFQEAFEAKLNRLVRNSGAAADDLQAFRLLNSEIGGGGDYFEIELNFIRSKMELPLGTLDVANKLTPGPDLSPDYPKAYGILTDIENTIKEILGNVKAGEDNNFTPSKPKNKLPLPLVYIFVSKNAPTYNTWYLGDGGWSIQVDIENVSPEPKNEYIPDTTPFKRRGLVKIRGQEEYRAAGQIIGKDLQANPETVASDNQTHVNGSETDEQVENSIAVSVWYFKNKTTGDVNTIEVKSKLPKSNYTNEYQRIKGIIG